MEVCNLFVGIREMKAGGLGYCLSELEEARAMESVRLSHSIRLPFTLSSLLDYLNNRFLNINNNNNNNNGWETWSLTLREESRQRVFENRILRWIFGPKRDENGEWRRLHNEELHSFYRSPNIIRVIKSKKIRMGRVYTYNISRSFKIIIGKPSRRLHNEELHSLYRSPNIDRAI